MYKIWHDYDDEEKYGVRESRGRREDGRMGVGSKNEAARKDRRWELKGEKERQISEYS